MGSRQNVLISVFVAADWSNTSGWSKIQSPLSKPGIFGTGTKCPSKSDVRLIGSQIKGVKKGKNQP